MSSRPIDILAFFALIAAVLVMWSRHPEWGRDVLTLQMFAWAGGAVFAGLAFGLRSHIRSRRTR